LWQHLEFIDAIESDHAPHTIEEKNSDTPPFGVPGLETTLPLLLTRLYEDKITKYDIERLCYFGPAKILHLREDKTTNIEIDPNEKHVIERADLFTKCGWSPFEGSIVFGRIK